MSDDERIVEVIARPWRKGMVVVDPYADAQSALRALRADGFDVYRLDNEPLPIPRGFTRCDECERTPGRVRMAKGRVVSDALGWSLAESSSCPSCSGSGLVPTEKLRKEAAAELFAWDTINDRIKSWHFETADAVLRKVAEHIGEDR